MKPINLLNSLDRYSEYVIKSQFRSIMGTELDLMNPKTYNEKIQWLKLYDHNPKYTSMADKYEVRKYISETIGEKYLVPLLGVWEKFEDIDFNTLPNQFVLKCTHDSGGVVICNDKRSLNIEQIRETIETCLKRNYYSIAREIVYKDIKPLIIAEKYLVDESGTELKDYKVYCFNGEPKIIQVNYDKFAVHKTNFYSIQWEYQPFSMVFTSVPDVYIPKPSCLDEMLHIARMLSSGIPHLRTDFYIIGEDIYFGELTFYPAAGYAKFDPPEWDKTFGDWINLPER